MTLSERILHCEYVQAPLEPAIWPVCWTMSSPMKQCFQKCAVDAWQLVIRQVEAVPRPSRVIDPAQPLQIVNALLEQAHAQCQQ